MAIISLRSGSNTARIDTLGAQIISWKDNSGREHIWQGDPEIWGEHSPILFPICGRLNGGSTMIGKTSYAIPMHGFACRSDFSVHRQLPDEVTLLLTDSAATRDVYPFAFRLYVTYKLRTDGFEVTLRVENHDNTVMPFNIGGHPGFVLPMEENASFEDYDLTFDQVYDGANLLVPVGGLVDGSNILPGFPGTKLAMQHSLFDRYDTLLLPGIPSRKVGLISHKTGHGLRFAFPDMEVLAVWTCPGKQAPYVCLEPWHGLPGIVGDSGILAERPYTTLLQPDESWTGSFSAELI